MGTGIRKKVLFIHHGSVAGGAPLSMLYTMQGVRAAGYEPIAALLRPSDALHDLYNDAGFETIETPWIPIFITWSGSEGKRWNPIMWRGVYRAWKRWGRAHKMLQKLLEAEEIDIVHLNSVALSNPATLLMKINFPFIWHVREHGPNHKGKRFDFLKKRLLQAKHVIFLSRAEKESWLGTTDHGDVVHNFINLNQFDCELSGKGIRKQYDIDKNTKVILYVGGKKKHKGIFELVEALGILKRQFGEPFVCLMPDSILPPPADRNRIEKKIANLMSLYNIESCCIMLPFDPNITEMFAACDLLVFPATKPHFARPIIEASAMAKPVIASDLKAIDELVRHGQTGYLTPMGDTQKLADYIQEILSNDLLAKEMGGMGREFAVEEFEYEKQMNKIIEVYQKISLL